MEAINIKNLTFKYPKSEKKILNLDKLSVKKGAIACLCGPSGCGKTTLLRHLKPSLRPKGEKAGDIKLLGKRETEITPREEPTLVGYVLQNPDNQIVTDKVWHELCFGLENIGMEQDAIRLKTAEIASFFGIQEWFHRKVNQLSGGQKQILNLASVMAMQPEILILDEPTSQLDPIAASEFFDVIRKINADLGTTILMTEHRLEDVIPMADQLIVMEDGQVIYNGEPRDVVRQLGRDRNEIFPAMPAPAQIFNMMEVKTEADSGKDLYPLNVREGRRWLDEFIMSEQLCDKLTIKSKLKDKDNSLRGFSDKTLSGIQTVKEKTIEIKDIWFRYEKNSKDILKGVNLGIYSGEILAIVGGNGTGKSTLLSVINENQKPFRGRIKYKNGKNIVTLPQNPQSFFTEDTVFDEILEVLKDDKSIAEETANQKAKKIIEYMELSHLTNHHPYDISGGEQQRLAIGKVLLKNPDVILLDEPTKGLDIALKDKLGDIFKKLRGQGKALVIVSHDMDFCSRYADRCVLFFDGNVNSDGDPVRFFSGNNFYTTTTNRMCRRHFPNAILPEDVLSEFLYSQNRGSCTSDTKFYTSGKDCEGGSDDNGSRINNSVHLYASEKNESPLNDKKILVNKKTLVKSKLYLGMLAILGGLFFIGYQYGGDRTYYIVSSIVILIFMLPFFINFEGKKLDVKIIVILSVLIALGVAGRQAFFMMPQVKPVLAVAIVAGISFGAAEGFITGAMIAFVSNFFFGQGPWTPWQMLAMGMAGLIAGIIFKPYRYKVAPNKKERLLVSIFGLASGYLYGLIVDLWTLFAYTESPSFGAYVIVKSTAVWYDSILAVSTFIFLWLIYEPMVKKLNRVKLKYDL